MGLVIFGSGGRAGGQAEAKVIAHEIRSDVELAASAAEERVMKVERRRDGGRADSICFVSVAGWLLFRFGWVGFGFGSLPVSVGAAACERAI